MTQDAIHILHVDDQDELLELVATFLEREDDRFDVDTASTGENALETLQEAGASIDCVVSDYDMPDMDGIELLETVRASHPRLPFILYTGKGSEEIASEAIAAGVTDYLQKGTSADQYTILANRIANAVDQARARRRADELARVNTVVRDINRALVHATDSAAIDDRVCEILTDADPYRFAWIGDVDQASGRFEARAAAGAEAGYLETVTITADEDASGQGPAGRAWREKTVAVSQDIEADEDFDPWRQAAADRGFRAVAGVPMTYDDADYGVLCVYADRANAFDERERELLADLGDTIAHAHRRVEVQTLHEEQYRTLFEEAPVMFCITDTVDGEPIIEDCNRQFADTLGRNRAAIRGTPLADHYAEESARELLEGGGYARALAGDFVREQRTLVTASGEPIETWLRAAPRRNRHGAIVGTHALFVDVTDERRLEALTRLRERMELALDQTNAILIEIDFESDVVVRLGEIESLYGVTADEVPTWRAFVDRVVHPEDRASVTNLLERLAAGEATTGQVEYRTDPPGEAPARRMRAEIFVETEGDRSPNEPEAVGLVRDVTEQTRRERALYRTNALLATLFDTLPVGVLAEDEDREVIAVNQRMFDLFDLEGTPNELVGSDGRTLAGSVADAFVDAEGFVEQIDRRVVDREPVDAEELSLQDGRTLTRSHRPIDLPDGLGHLWVYRDITERKRHERQLERQTDRLEAFASAVSHDLRNPLSAARGHLELARESDVEDAAAHLDRVGTALDRMSDLIEDVLALARESEGALEVTSVELGPIAERCWTNVETDAAALRVSTDRTILADEARLARLFENLLANAVEHGGPTVTVSVEALPDGFAIEDDGAGISRSERDRIFEDGFSTTDGGTGYGLGIVREIVEAHGWSIAVAEGADGGARFEITGVECGDG